MPRALGPRRHVPAFDHRLIDGRQGSRLLADTAAILNNPGLALL
ncbi:MAG TPA: hypothetical protein VIR33_14925 [Thermopolyspora sp.]